MKNREPIYTENHFLQDLQEKKVPVAIYLFSGIKLQGFIEDFSDAAIFLSDFANHAKHEKAAQEQIPKLPQLIFKHAISTIMPQLP